MNNLPEPLIQQRNMLALQLFTKQGERSDWEKIYEAYLDKAE
jgi:hypothetical protein